jgi:hypothetical protein
MHRRSSAILSVVLTYLLLTGCGDGPRATDPLPLTVKERGGSVTMEFGKWILVFEGISTGGVQVGARCSLNRPMPEAGQSEQEFGSLRIKQSWDDSVNRVEVNGRAFVVADEGREVTFTDHTYKAEGEARRTIVIKKNGSTREQSEG